MNAADVADFFITAYDRELTPCQLNQLVYLTQAWSTEMSFKEIVYYYCQTP